MLKSVSYYTSFANLVMMICTVKPKKMMFALPHFFLASLHQPHHHQTKPKDHLKEMKQSFKKQKICTMFLSSYRNMSGSLGRRELGCGNTSAAGKCFYSFFEFSLTFVSVSISRQKQGEQTCFLFLLENTVMRKRKNLLSLIIKM